MQPSFQQEIEVNKLGNPSQQDAAAHTLKPWVMENDAKMTSLAGNGNDGKVWLEKDAAWLVV